MRKKSVIVVKKVKDLLNDGSNIKDTKPTLSKKKSS